MSEAVGRLTWVLSKLEGAASRSSGERTGGGAVACVKCLAEHADDCADRFLDPATPDAEVDAYLREHGGDPEAIAARGAALAADLLAKRAADPPETAGKPQPWCGRHCSLDPHHSGPCEYQRGGHPVDCPCCTSAAP